MKNVPETSRVQ